MNRLILIGNGFDLAHNLETDYNSFIVYYLKKCFTEAQNIKSYEDTLLRIDKRSYSNHFKPHNLQDVNKLIDFFYKKGFSEVLKNEKQFDISNTGYYWDNPFHVEINSKLLKQLLIKCSDASWVDIENEFYTLLKEFLGSSSSQKLTNLLSLNRSLKFIIEELETYLSAIKPQKLLNGYKEIFESKINKEDIVNGFSTQIPKDSLILNFNYTSTAENYFNTLAGPIQVEKKIKINYIHGKIGDLKNPIIFGFGDELDGDYDKMELEKINAYFEYIKSFWYFKTSNYHDLIRFIEADEFQVYILGHSCGLSDRTMLNMIFEHANCKSIKIYYHDRGNGNNNFKNLTQEISRHFKNKTAMRRKIVPFDKSKPMPQID